MKECGRIKTKKWYYAKINLSVKSIGKTLYKYQKYEDKLMLELYKPEFEDLWFKEK